MAGCCEQGDELLGFIECGENSFIVAHCITYSHLMSTPSNAHIYNFLH